jgi:hypothetical protein
MTQALLMVGAVACLAGAAHATAGLYAVSDFGNFNSQTLYRIDPASGQTVRIGETGLVEIAGLDYDVATDRLLALDSLGDLYLINRETAAATLVESTTGLITEGGIEVGAATYTTIFDELHRLEGGVWVRIGESGLGDRYDVSGLEAVPGVGLLGLVLSGDATDSLVAFDVNTGAARLIADLDTNGGATGGLAFNHETGVLYATNGSGLYTYSVAGETLAPAFGIGLSGVSGIAYVPGPGTGALAAIGVLVMAHRRRAK